MKSKLFLAFLLTSQVAQANWSFSEKPYEMDPSKDACVAEIVTKDNDLELNFPKDGKGFPVVKMTNKFNRDYFGARLFLSRDRIRFIGKDDNGDIEFYMIPKNAEELETVINIIKRDSKLKIEKLYSNNGRFATGSGEFSLKGSSAALNKLRDCLGGQYISSSQDRLITELNQRSFISLQDDLGVNFGKYMALGKEVYEGIQNWDKRSADSEAAQALVEEKKQAPEYQQLKREKTAQEVTINTAKGELTTISENEDFFANADQIIADLEATKATKDEEERNLNVSVNSQEAVLDGLLLNLKSLQDTLDRKQANVDNSKAVVAQANADIQFREGAISDIEDVLRGSIQREASLVSQTRILQQAKDDAKWRSDNSRTIKRELEESLYRQFGGTPRDLEDRIALMNREVKEMTARAEVLEDYQEDMEDVVELAQRITAINPEIQRVREELQCFRGSRGAESARCLESSLQQIDASINALTAARSQHQQNKCKRLFGIGSKKCKERRDAAIRDLTAKITEAQQDKAALQERIRIIRTTGEDPQRDQTIAALEAKLAQKIALRDAAIKATQDKINSIRPPRRERIITLDNVLNCRPEPQKTCERLAAEAARRLEAMVDQANRDKDRLTAEKTKAENNLRDLNRELRAQVDGIETRLFNEWRSADAAYQQNLSDIGREDAFQASKRSELETAQIQLGGLRQALGRALDSLRQDEMARDEASRAVTSYKTQNDIDGKERRLDSDVKKLAALAKETIDLGKKIEQSKFKRATINAEIGTYPAKKAALETTIDEATVALGDLLPRFNELESEIAELQREANRLNSENTEAQQTVKASIELIRTKY